MATPLRVQLSLKKGADHRQPPASLAARTTVVIVSYNASRTIRECLSSIVASEPDADVTVVDNASTDDTARLVSQEFPRVRLVRNDVNAGFGGGNNVGAAHAEREFLAFLNPDTEVLAGWLEAMVRPLAEDPSVGLVTPKVLLKSDPNRINVAGLDVHLSGISMCRGAGSPRDAFDEPAEVAAISGVAFAARREVFEALGGFDPGFFLYMEDVDLSLRAWLVGCRCVYVPDAVVLHDYEMRLDPRKTYHVERGRYRVLLKCFSARTLLALLPVMLLAELITWGWVMLKRPSALGQKARALASIVRSRREIMEARRPIQAKRAVLDREILARLDATLDFGQLAEPGLARLASSIWNPVLKATWWTCRRPADWGAEAQSGR